MHNLKELKVWHRAVELSTDVYKVTSEFPREEKYGLTSQIRRSAVSIPSNIAEGAGRNTKKEFIHFLGIASGSSFELQTQLIVSRKLDLVDARVDVLLDEIDQIQKMIYGLQSMLGKD